MSVQDSDPGQIKRIQARLRKLETGFVTVGVHEGAGNYPGQDAPSVVEVALWHEFGTTRLPERSWLRACVDSQIGKINQWRDELLAKVVIGEIGPEKALEALGFRIQELIRNFIKTYQVQPPNAPSTIEQKRREGVTPPNMPLYESGLFLRSITFQVHL